MTDVAVVLLVWGIVAGFVLDIVVGTIASWKGRSGALWFLAALFFTPIVALLMLIAAGHKDTDDRSPVPKENAAERRQARRAGA